LLFPEKRQEAEKLFRSVKLIRRLRNDFEPLHVALEAASKALIDQPFFLQADLVGFSVCFNQLLPSLHLARLIKERYPVLPIVFGGSSCCGALGDTLITTFPQIDYLVDGEGEESLLRLARFLNQETTELPQSIKTVNKTPVTGSSPRQLAMDQLVCPDYSGYFVEMKQTFPHAPFIPILPVEFSRGCWWNRCTFCNLNLQWHHYRQKSALQMYREIEALSFRHECLHFTFTDNALPPKAATSLFSELATKNKDYQFFAEIRAKTKPEELQNYHQGGLRTVQVGIESLSTRLLLRMQKGTTAMDNIAAMKFCAAAGIRLEGNLIVEYPGTTQEEIDETISSLDFVLPFLPLACATFFLGFQSPIYQRSADHNISKIIAHPKNKLLFPDNILSSMALLVNDFQGQRRKLRLMWRPVREKVTKWQTFHTQRSIGVPPLSYRDGENFLIIRQELLQGLPLLHRLRGPSRGIYLFCDSPKKLQEISTAFPNIDQSKLKPFLDQLTEKRLVYRENDTYLALAIRER
jgi:ribosomal peptide maturation radical SAM protein 1